MVLQVLPDAVVFNYYSLQNFSETWNVFAFESFWIFKAQVFISLTSILLSNLKAAAPLAIRDSWAFMNLWWRNSVCSASESVRTLQNADKSDSFQFVFQAFQAYDETVQSD